MCMLTAEKFSPICPTQPMSPALPKILTMPLLGLTNLLPIRTITLITKHYSQTDNEYSSGSTSAHIAQG